MPQARRMNNRVSDADRAEIVAEARREVMREISTADSFESLLDAAEEETEAGLSWEDVKSMTTDQIIANQSLVDEVLARGPQGAALTFERSQQEPSTRKPTGQQALGNPVPSGPLTMDVVRGMSTGEINARWSEVQAVLQRGR